jgi:type II secretory pathway pseudopilin PulG
MVELAVSMTILLILSAIAIPSLMNSFRAYQLNDAASRLSGMLKFTRFEAVRQNKQLCFLMNQKGSSWFLGTDSTCSGTLDPNGKQQLITGFATVLPATAIGLPGQSAICNKLVNGAGPCLDDTLSGLASASIRFDPRGAIRVGGNVSASVFVFYVGSNATNPGFGFRAVILLPSGSMQIWTGPDPGGAWRQVA